MLVGLLLSLALVGSGPRKACEPMDDAAYKKALCERSCRGTEDVCQAACDSYRDDVCLRRTCRDRCRSAHFRCTLGC